jgi:ParB/RepB/Spo0J family partition protein
MTQALQTRIPLSMIDDPSSVLRFVDTAAVEYHELKDSIDKNGVLQPILVRPVGERFEVVDGWYRLTICRELRHTHIDCSIREIPDDLILITQIQCNAVRHPTENFEYAKAIRKIMRANPDLPLRTISQMVGKGSTWVGNVLRLNLLSKRCMDLAQSGGIPLTNAYKLSHLPMPLQDEYIEEAVCMKTKEFSQLISEVVRQLKDGKSNDYLKGLFKNMNNFTENPFPQMKTLATLEKFLKTATKSKVKQYTDAEKCRRVVDGFMAGIKFCLSMDTISLEKRAKEINKMIQDREKERFKFEDTGSVSISENSSEST